MTDFELAPGDIFHLCEAAGWNPEGVAGRDERNCHVFRLDVHSPGYQFARDLVHAYRNNLNPNIWADCYLARVIAYQAVEELESHGTWRMLTVWADLREDVMGDEEKTLRDDPVDLIRTELIESSRKFIEALIRLVAERTSA